MGVPLIARRYWPRNRRTALAAAVDGFFSDGRLHTNDNNVTINDANEAVLGSLTTLGTASADGRLNAPNGLIIEFGKNITGRGLIDTQNDPTKPVINNGLIQGDSPANKIVMDGYVKGVGYSDRATPRFNYTDDPFYTDGLRVVLILGETLHPLDAIDFLDWEQPPLRREVLNRIGASSSK